jgi:Protein of unknown function (DUF1097)
MSKLTALALSIAVLGGVWAFVASNPLAGIAVVWVGFIAWACYFHTGADTAALQKTIVGMSYGAIIAAIALALVVGDPTGDLGSLEFIETPIIIAITVFPLVIVAGVNLLSVVPANVYGYAATAGLALSTNTAANATALNLSNPAILVIISVVLGAVFGMLSGKLSGKLSS